jgi:hypothetical protein
MRNFREIVFLLCCLNVFSAMNAQDENLGADGNGKMTVKPSPFSVRADFSVPNPVNPAWKKCMVGIGEANVIFDMRLAGNFFAGVGYKGSLFYVPRNFMYSYELKTKMQMHCGFISMGYDIYKSNTFFITPVINSGMALTKFSHIQCKKEMITWKPQYRSWFIEAQGTLTWLVDPRVGLQGHVSFVLVDHVWNPEFACMQDWIALGSVNRNAITSYYTLGFGVYLGIGKGKTRAEKS